MKKLSYLLLGIAAILITAGSLYAVAGTIVAKNSDRAQRSISGSGTIVTRSVDAPDFDKIDASRAVRVVITDDASDKIRIEADDNLIDYIVVKTDNGTLNVGIDQKIRSISNIHAVITVPSNGRIRSLEASSAAGIICKTALTAYEFEIEASSAAKIAAAVKADKCDISASSAAKITAAVEADECDIELSSATQVELTGSARSCEAELTSASKLSAAGFVVDHYEAEATSSAKAEINCTGWLEASVSSAAKIVYSGNCSTSIQKSSGGSVVRAN